MKRATKSQTESKKVEGDLKNSLKAVRTRLGLSQSDLAGRAGVARQTIGGIEAALYAPSAAVALRLARALGCRVEELFWLEEEPTATLSVTRALSGNAAATGVETEHAQERLLIGQVGQKWIAHALRGDAAFRSEMMPADGIALPAKTRARGKTGSGEQVEVQLLDSLDSLKRTVLIAGCAPALSLWTRSAQRFHPGLRPAWIHANSTRALEALARGEVHVAGLHLCDPRTGEENRPFVRAAMGDAAMGDAAMGDAAMGDAVVLVNFGVWDEGLLLQGGNPKRISGLADLGRENVHFTNRESGAGSRLLFDTLLEQEQVPKEAVRGYGEEVFSHQAVARSLCEGKSDAGMGTASMAEIYGLDFLPLRAVRFDLAVRAEFLKQEAVSQLFETLSHKAVRLQLQKLGGYDTSRAGERVLT